MKAEEIVQMIKDRRKAKKLSQEDMGKKLRVSRKTYRKWERNILNMPLLRVIQILNLLGLEMVFMEGNDLVFIGTIMSRYKLVDDCGFSLEEDIR